MSSAEANLNARLKVVIYSHLCRLYMPSQVYPDAAADAEIMFHEQIEDCNQIMQVRTKS